MPATRAFAVQIDPRYAVQPVPSSRHLRGIALMLGSVVCFVGMSTLVKLAREAGMGTAELMLWRMAPGIPLLAVYMRWRGIALRPRRPGPVALRAVFGGAAMGLYFWSLSALTLLQVAVIGLSQPVLVAVVAVPLLAERLRGAAWFTLPLALVGAALVVLPDPVLLQGDLTALRGFPLLATVAALGAAACSAIAHVLIRRATGPVAHDQRPADTPQTVVLWFSIVVAVGVLGLGLVRGDLAGLPPSMSTGHALATLLAMSGLGVAGQLFLSAAYARVSAPTIAIVGYARMPVGLLADVVVWGALTGVSGSLGAVVVLVAGVVLARSRQPTTRDA